MSSNRFLVALVLAVAVPACGGEGPSGAAGAGASSADGGLEDTSLESGQGDGPMEAPVDASAADQAHVADVWGDEPMGVDGAEEAAIGDGAPEDSNESGGLDAGMDAASALSCFGEPPAGAPEPLPWPQYAGNCPSMVAAPAMTTLVSSGAERKFMFVLPAGATASEKLPVVFVWHWLGGSADDAYSQVEVQAAADLHRFIALIPQAKGDLLFRWPFSIADSQGRMDEEFQFFEDMLACTAASYPKAVRQCVASLGVSAGALFSDQLAGARATRLSSFVSLSGGVGTTARPWAKPARKLSGLVLWGGPTDDYQGLYDFNKGSLALEAALVGEGNFFVECIHNCGHAVPPFEAPAGGTRFDPVWRFILDHPYWVAPGTSIYSGSPLPVPFPSWCGQGKGGAVPRPDGSPC